MGFGGVHPVQLLIVLALALLFFGGRGRISAIMGDMAKGVRSFRQGLKEDDQGEADETKPLEDGDTINVTPQKDESKA